MKIQRSNNDFFFNWRKIRELRAKMRNDLTVIFKKGSGLLKKTHQLSHKARFLLLFFSKVREMRDFLAKIGKL